MSRYTYQAPIGSGGFSDVNLYNDTNLKRKVAIKTIRKLDPRNPLANEISALLQMRSKHVVQVYDLTNFTDGNQGIVMEHIEGDDLFHQRFTNLQDIELLKLLWQIASGIADIHRHGLIHRDIKPNNMKMDSEGIIKIFDFGLARENQNDNTLGFKGTHGFAAPELYYHNPNFTQAIDTYAFGATVIYLLNQQLPNELHQHPPQPIPPDIFNHSFFSNKSELSTLIQQCFAAEPQQRPSMAAIQQALANYLTQDKHQAVVILNNQQNRLNSDKKQVKIVFDNIGAFIIVYDGFKFYFDKVSGEVYINNLPAQAGNVIPDSCVVAFGHARREWYERAYVTFDISKPEVIL